jgi:hypothetical protein
VKKEEEREIRSDFYGGGHTDESGMNMRRCKAVTITAMRSIFDKGGALVCKLMMTDKTPIQVD